MELQDWWNEKCAGSRIDGELYFVTSLIFASNRWGNDTGINYLKEAQHILDCSMQKAGMDRTVQHQSRTSAHHLYARSLGWEVYRPFLPSPAFYEVWAKWANDGRSQFWKESAEKAKWGFLHPCIIEKTGLNPDYCNWWQSDEDRSVAGWCFPLWLHMNIVIIMRRGCRCRTCIVRVFDSFLDH